MWRLVKHDFQQGTLRSFGGYLCAFVICLCSAAPLQVLVKSLIENMGLPVAGTVIDYYMYATKGMGVYHITKETVFQIPVYWFAYHIILAYLIGYYAQQDLCRYGNNCLLVTGSRTKWWLSKCLWCIGSVVLYYLMGFIGAAVYTWIAGGKFSFTVTKDIMKYVGKGLIYLNNGEILLLVLLLPCLVSVGVSMVQMLLSLKIGAVASFACIGILYILSAYYTNPVLIGNYTIWQRNDTVGIGSGIYISIGICLSLLMIVVSMLTGILYVDRKDIL